MLVSDNFHSILRSATEMLLKTILNYVTHNCKSFVFKKVEGREYEDGKMWIAAVIVPRRTVKASVRNVSRNARPTTPPGSRDGLNSSRGNFFYYSHKITEEALSTLLKD
jgi:hypothetical protein